MSASVCAAVTVTRRRAVPGGTVGGRIAGAQTPSASKAADSRSASPDPPTMTGNDGRLARQYAKPHRAEAVPQSRRVGMNTCPPLRLLLHDAQRRPRGGNRRRGGRRGIHKAARALAQPFNQNVCEPATKPPADPSDFAQRPHVDRHPPVQGRNAPRPRAPSAPALPSRARHPPSATPRRSSQTETKAGRGAMSPSMLNTPSVTSSARRNAPRSASSARAWSASA